MIARGKAYGRSCERRSGLTTRAARCDRHDPDHCAAPVCVKRAQRRAQARKRALDRRAARTWKALQQRDR